MYNIYDYEAELTHCNEGEEIPELEVQGKAYTYIQTPMATILFSRGRWEF